MLLIIIIAILTYLAVQPQTIVTTPQQPTTPVIVTPEEPTPVAEPVERGEPTPKAPEPTEPGLREDLHPNEIHLWANDIRVPAIADYNYFIPIKESNLKTFAGSFGPYYEDVSDEVSVKLCAEFYKTPAAPACEWVPIIYKEKYISFARGYQFDEYIGGLAAKDYLVYYTVYAGDNAIAYSNKGVIRTVKD